jgi:hypothetical protein
MGNHRPCYFKYSNTSWTRIQGFIHWDYDPETKPVNVQGVLALADQTDENVGFSMSSKLFKTYDTWKLTQPMDRNRFQPNTDGFG